MSLSTVWTGRASRPGVSERTRSIFSLGIAQCFLIGLLCDSHAWAYLGTLSPLPFPPKLISLPFVILILARPKAGPCFCTSYAHILGALTFPAHGAVILCFRVSQSAFHQRRVFFFFFVTLRKILVSLCYVSTIPNISCYESASHSVPCFMDLSPVLRG